MPAADQGKGSSAERKRDVVKLPGTKEHRGEKPVMLKRVSEKD